MADDYARSKGRPGNYKLDRGGMPAEFGPFNGVVKSNIDPTRSGRLKVYIDAFGDGSEDDSTKWTTVRYLPSYYGATPAPQQAPDGTGTFPGNRSSYGMWFTTPDIGVNVICIFVNGDRSQGFYIGVAPEQGINHMIPVSAMVPGGLRMGSPALTSRGFTEGDFDKVAALVDRAVTITQDIKASGKAGTKLKEFKEYVDTTPPAAIAELAAEVETFAKAFPTIGFEKADMRYQD